MWPLGLMEGRGLGLSGRATKKNIFFAASLGETTKKTGKETLYGRQSVCVARLSGFIQPKAVSATFVAS